VKYWVYKDSRILGPFDKDAVAGLPGLDAATLVSAGDPASTAEGGWRPAAEVAELGSLALGSRRSWTGGEPEFPTAHGLLDHLQLDAAGLIGDDDFPGLAGELFQDADMRRNFGELLTPREPVGEAELITARTRVSELTAQLEMLYKRVTELESSQTNLVHRLAEKEILLRTQTPPPAAPAPFLAAAPAPVAPPVVSPPGPVAAVPPPLASAPTEWPTIAPLGDAPAFPTFGAPGTAPIKPPPVILPPEPPMESFVAPAPPVVPPTPPVEAFAPLQAPPPVPAPLSAPTPVPPPVATSEAAPAPKRSLKSAFERKTLKIVPTVKAFRVVGEDEAAPAAAQAPSMPEAAPVPAPALEAAPAAVPFDWNAAAPAPQVPAPAVPQAPPSSPALFAAPEPAPISIQPVASDPLPSLAPPRKEDGPATSFTPEALAAAGITPMQTPAPPPPATLTFGGMSQPDAAPAPVATPHTPETSPFSDAALPPSTARFSPAVPASPDSAPLSPSTQEVLARLAKPAELPPTAAPRPARSNKPFLIGGALVVVVLIAVLALFLRHPKELKQMTDLDDGRSRVGAEAVDDTTRLPLVKPKQLPQAAPAPAAPVAPAPAPAEAPQAASQAKLDAAVAMVKEFPLDGTRGTVGQWLQYSYTATPDAGQEAWSASETAEKTYLVEYRFTPTRHGAPDAHYLFEADMDRGFVLGKNLDARNMLAGAPPPDAESAPAKPKTKKKPARAKAPKRSAPRVRETEQPKDVPLLPLPNEGELRPPSEDDGAFSSDTVNSGI
jgi:hypothetical protein